MGARVRQLFAAAVELAPHRRAAFLDAECGRDSQLRAEVESLLDADEDADGFLEPPQLHTTHPGTGKIGRYTLGRRIGSGGMGTVFEAQQERPRRNVALKLLRSPFPSAGAQARFALEAEILGRLEHPGIARIYEAGVHASELGAVPFLAIELIAGARPITEFADGLQLRARLELMRSVCDALHHAHQRGVIHRDIKPSNILVDAQGHPRLIDFGVARATDLDVTGPSVRTEAGQLIGTLKYMSPEQCAGDPQGVDVRSDVYALGLVLYEMLTGELPYALSDVSPFEVPSVIRETSPRPPSSVDRSLRGDIDAILLTALEKDRARRYPSAAALGRDIERYLEGAPVEARRGHGLYVLRKTLWRYRVVVSAVFAVVAALVAAFVIVTRAQSQAEVERAAERVAAAEDRAAAAGQLRRQAYAYRIALAQRAAEGGNPGRAKALLAACPADLRGWEWNRLRRLIDRSRQTLVGHRGPARSLALARSGRRMASGGDDGVVRLFVRDGDGWRAERELRGHPEAVLAVAISPDGGAIASGDDAGHLRVWSTETGELRWSLVAHDGERIADLAWAADGERLASAGHDHTVRLWNDGAEAGVLRGHEDNVTSVAFLGGRRLVSGAEDHTVKIWDLQTRAADTTIGPLSEAVETVAVSPDGRQVATGGWDNVISRWAADSGVLLGTIEGHDDGVVGLAWPVAAWIVSASRDDTIGVTRLGGEMERFPGHDLGVEDVVADSSGHVASASLDGTIRVWERSPPPTGATLEGHGRKVHALAFTPDGAALLSGAGPRFDPDAVDNTVRLWDVATGRERLVSTEHGATVRAIAVSSDGRLAASGDVDGLVLVYEASTLAPRARISDSGSAVAGLVFADDRLYIGRVDGTVQGCAGTTCTDAGRGRAPVLDMSAGQGVLAVHADGSIVRYPQGRTVLTVDGAGSIAARDDGALAVGTTDGRIVSVDADGNEAWTVATFGRELVDLAYCVGGTRIVTASGDYGVRLFDAATGEMYMVVGRHSSVATAVACNPTTDVLASASFDYSIRVWR